MALIGCQQPRLSHVPEGDPSRGDIAVSFAKFCGMTLFPWQEDLLRDMCRTEPSGRWAARTCAVVVPRQNGKGEVLVARELAGIFLFGEKTILHTAHLMSTAMDAMRRLWEFISKTDELMAWWQRPGEFYQGRPLPGTPEVMTSNGKEAIVFPNGAKIHFQTRTKKTARGLSIDLLVLDECFNMPTEIHNAMTPTIMARENAQTIWISSPVNREEHQHGAMFSAKRWAGIDKAPGVLFKEWSPDPEDDPFDQNTWAKCNPSLVTSGVGTQLTNVRDYALGAKSDSKALNAFRVEILGDGRWYPRDGDRVEEFIPVLSDAELTAMAVQAVDINTLENVHVVIDASTDREKVAVAVGGRRGGKTYGYCGYVGDLVVAPVVEVVTEVIETIDPEAVVVDEKNPAWSVAEALDREGFEVGKLAYKGVKAATRAFLQGQRDNTWFLVDPAGYVREAFEYAQLKEDANGQVRWTRTEDGVICPLTAVSYAMWLAATENTDPEPETHIPPTRKARVIKKQQGAGVNVMQF